MFVSQMPSYTQQNFVSGEQWADLIGGVATALRLYMIGVNFIIKMWAHMTSVDYKLKTEVQGHSPWSGVRKRSPLKLKAIFSFRRANEAQICPFLLSCKLLKHAFRNNIVALSVCALHAEDSFIIYM